MSFVRPGPSRLLRGVTLAALAASAPLVLLGPVGIFAALVALPIAFAHAVLLGLPAYLLLRRWIAIGWPVAAAAGLAIGAAPVALLLLLEFQRRGAEARGFGLRMPPPGEWLLTALPTSLLFGALGLAGGLTFWAVALRGAEPEGVDAEIFA